jgi:hypothetical protein
MMDCEEGNGMCCPCPYYCSTCDYNLNNNIFTCDCAHIRGPELPCACPEGYFDDLIHDECFECHAKCTKCSNSTDCD